MGQVTTDAAAPHNLPAEQVVASLGSSRHGLSSEEAARRLLEYGRNELQREKAVSPLEIFLGQFKNFLIVILLAAAVVSFAVGERVDAIVIGVIILFASGLGFVQEYRAEKAMEVLKRMAALTSTVVPTARTWTYRPRRSCPGTSWCCPRETASPPTAVFWRPGT